MLFDRHHLKLLFYDIVYSISGAVFVVGPADNGGGVQQPSLRTPADVIPYLAEEETL